MIFYCIRDCRRHQHVLHHAVHGRDVYQDVRGRLRGVLQLDVQPLRLLRHRLQLGRGGADAVRPREAGRCQRVEMRQTAASFQSHKVSRASL